MPTFFRLYEKLRPLRFLLAFLGLIIVLTILSHPFVFIFAGALMALWALAWPIPVNDCCFTASIHRPQDFAQRIAWYAVPAATLTAYTFITYLGVFLDMGIYKAEDINTRNIGLLMLWYGIFAGGFTLMHMVIATEITYNRLLKDLR